MKKKYKTYYCILVILVISIFIGLYNVLKIKKVEIDQIKDSIINSTDVSSMQEDDGTKLRKLYNISKIDVDKFIYYCSKSNMEASEIMVIKPKSESDIKNISTTIKDRVKKQSDSFRNYNEEQYYILSDYILEEKNGFLIFIVSKDVKEINKSINSLF